MRLFILFYLAFGLLLSCDKTTQVDPAAGKNNPQQSDAPKGQKAQDTKALKNPTDTPVVDPKGNKPAHPPQQDPQAAISKDPWATYQNLAPNSNEAVLIKRAADYIVRSKKEHDYLAEIKTAQGRENIEMSVKTVMNSANFIALVNMFKKMLLVHRCKTETLEGINRLNYFLSSEILYGDKLNSDGIKPLVTLLQKTYKRPDLENIIKHAVVSYVIEKYKKDPSEDPEVDYDIPVECNKVSASKKALMKACLAQINFMHDPESKVLTEAVNAILKIPAVGLQYYKDKIMGTDKYVFSVLGFNKNTAYGNNVIPLEAELRKLAWSTPVAATYFNNQIPDLFYGALSGRVWVEAKPWGGTPNEAEVDYEASKIKGDNDITSSVFAMEFLGRVISYHRGNNALRDKDEVKKALGDPDPKKSFDKISPDEVRKYMKAVDSHALIEGHIPVFTAAKIYKVVLFDAVYDQLAHPLKNIPDNKFEQVLFEVGKPVENQMRLNNKAESYSAPQ